jgi:excisionase family DNA binding protein
VPKHSHPENGKELLTVGEAAEYLRCSKSSLNKWRISGRGPRFVYVGALVRYRRADVLAYVATRVRSSTSEEVSPAA